MLATRPLVSSFVSVVDCGAALAHTMTCTPVASHTDRLSAGQMEYWNEDGSTAQVVKHPQLRRRPPVSPVKPQSHPAATPDKRATQHAESTTQLPPEYGFPHTRGDTAPPVSPKRHPTLSGSCVPPKQPQHAPPLKQPRYGYPQRAEGDWMEELPKQGFDEVLRRRRQQHREERHPPKDLTREAEEEVRAVQRDAAARAYEHAELHKENLPSLRQRMEQQRAEQPAKERDWREALKEDELLRRRELMKGAASSEASERLVWDRRQREDQRQKKQALEEQQQRTEQLKQDLSKAKQAAANVGASKPTGFSVPESKPYVDRKLPTRAPINVGETSFADWENTSYEKLMEQVNLGTRSSNNAKQARDRDEQRWTQFEALQCSDLTSTQIPLPSTEPHVYKGVDKDYFKALALRWHPDKFEAKYGSRLRQEEHRDIMEAVKGAFQMISEARR